MGRAERRKSKQRAQRQANKSGRRVRSAVTGEVLEPSPRGRVERLEKASAEAGQGRSTGRAGRPAPVGAPAPEAVGGRGSRSDRGRVALGNLRAAARRRAEVERSVAAGVVAARRAGATWRQVGEALGTSHVAALKRYG